MHVFLPLNPQISSLFLQKSCYYFQSDPKLLFLNVKISRIQRKYFSLRLQNHTQRTVMPIQYFKLLHNSMKTRPDMPLSYHLETVRIASRLIGGKR